MFDVYRKDNGRRVTVFGVETTNDIIYFLTWNEDTKKWWWLPADEYEPMSKRR